MDEKDPNTLYAASYQRQRTPWGFNGGGQGSGIWKTTDAGKTWTKIEGNGWPSGLLGRVAVEVSRSNPNYIYAHVEVGASTGTGVSPDIGDILPDGTTFTGGGGGGRGGGGGGGGGG